MIITKNVSGGGWKTSTQKAETFAKFLFLQQPKPKHRFSAVAGKGFFAKVSNHAH